MSTQNRRASFSTSTASSMAKRHATSSENSGKAAAAPPHLAKKRVPLNNLTNQRNVADFNCKTAPPHSALPSSGIKITTTKKVTSTSTGSNSKSSVVLVPCRNVSVRRTDEVVQSFVSSSPTRSNDYSETMDETMLSPDLEYIEKDDVSAVESIDRKTFSNLFISDHIDKTVSICNRDAAMEDMDTDVEMADIDDNDMDPQLCATIACDIYKHLRASEMKKRPSTDFMEKMQKDINPSMRAILIDWLVEVAEEYRLVPDTLYLTINYIDRYLSGNLMTRQRLQLLGVASMMIASKYEEICAPQVEEFCYITDNTYFKDEVLEMESAVLNFLKFELTAPTAKCFLRRFVTAAAKAANPNEVSTMQLECLANYIAELSLLEYSMLVYAPSLVAASAVFLAKYILTPSKRPWDSTLQHYTQYQASDLSSCVKDLHRLCLHSHTSNLPAVREKYSQHKYKYVAKKYCPPTIPNEFFYNRG